MLESGLLRHTSSYVGGRWMDDAGGEPLDVRNPATGEVLALLPTLDEAGIVAALDSAAAALATPNSIAKRQAWLLAIDEQLRARRDELGRIITLEHGKPLGEAKAEVDYAAGFFRFFAGQLHLLESEKLPDSIRGCAWVIHRRPAGVAGLITPWNFPIAMLAKKLAPALAAGCTVVAKPARLAPLASVALWHILEEIGIPSGLLNLIAGSASQIAEAFCVHDEVRIISFTGSTEVGKQLATMAAPHVKRLSLELGGNAPFIVFPDADLESAVAGLMANKFRAGGQTCVCTNRVYVHGDIADRFTELVAERVRALRVGDGIDPETDIGPLIDRDGFDKVAAHVADAIKRGAKRIVGEDPPRPAKTWGAFYPPTLLTGVTPAMLVCRDETFGPVVAMSTFANEEEVIAAANSTPYGLAAYLFTADEARADRVIRQLRFGHVGLNTGAGPTPEAPFGGMKESGYGREGGAEGLHEFCETQVVAQA
jgi:succinate-semialdehyde dehydrogenase/glutarate-semialdehyde dehydrogenase